MLLLAALASASAKELPSKCPWAGKEKPVVVAFSGAVTINGTDYSVDRPEDWTIFTMKLHDCNADSAIEAFQKWKTYDSKAFHPFFFIYIPKAKAWREKFEVALAATEPPRR